MRACWSKAPVTAPGQRTALTVIVDGVVLPNRFPCSHKAHAGCGDWLRADTDRRWSGTKISGKQETEPTSQCVKDSLFSENNTVHGVAGDEWLWTVPHLPAGMDSLWTAQDEWTHLESCPQPAHPCLGQVNDWTKDLPTAAWITARLDDAVTHTAHNHCGDWSLKIHKGRKREVDRTK